MVVKRNPDKTREKLLSAAFQEIHRAGFRAASIDTILSTTGVTKGALYHHFPNKLALGYAVVDEVIRPKVLQKWLEPVQASEDPIEALLKVLRGFQPEEMAVACETGCPLNNLAQEMSPVDDGFRQRLHRIYGSLRDGITEALIRGQQKGHVRAGVEPRKVATFYIANLEGALGMAKNARDCEVLICCLESMAEYLESLRTPASVI